MITNNVVYLFPKVNLAQINLAQSNYFGPKDTEEEQNEQEFDENHEPVEEWFDDDGIPIQMHWKDEHYHSNDN